MASKTNASMRSILIINPNTTKAMTDALKPLVDNLSFGSTYTFFTAPSGVASINNEDDAAVSASACLAPLKNELANHDAFLVCCYSQHPLVSQLRREIEQAGYSNKFVTGIFEASIATCLQSINPSEQFGIVSTGAQWTEILGEAVTDLLGSASSKRYAGCETTGLNADELHSTAKDEVDRRMKEATKRLLSNGDVQAICLGCAGMAGMDRTVRDACVEAMGEEKGRRVRIIDGVGSSGAVSQHSLWPPTDSFKQCGLPNNASILHVSVVDVFKANL